MSSGESSVAPRRRRQGVQPPAADASRGHGWMRRALPGKLPIMWITTNTSLEPFLGKDIVEFGSRRVWVCFELHNRRSIVAAV
jgi:hypothetical protein